MDSFPLDSIADRVAYLQRASGLDQATLSRTCKLSQAHIGMIARGDVAHPSVATLSAIAETCEVALDWLAAGRGDTPSADAIQAAVERARAVQTQPSPDVDHPHAKAS